MFTFSVFYDIIKVDQLLLCLKFVVIYLFRRQVRPVTNLHQENRLDYIKYKFIDILFHLCVCVTFYF